MLRSAAILTLLFLRRTREPRNKRADKGPPARAMRALSRAVIPALQGLENIYMHLKP